MHTPTMIRARMMKKTGPRSLLTWRRNEKMGRRRSKRRSKRC